MNIYIRDLKVINNLMLKTHKRITMFCGNGVQAPRERFGYNKRSPLSIHLLLLLNLCDL